MASGGKEEGGSAGPAGENLAASHVYLGSVAIEEDSCIQLLHVGRSSPRRERERERETSLQRVVQVGEHLRGKGPYR